MFASTATTDARAFALYGDTPGAVLGPHAEAIHGVDERVYLPSMAETAQVLGLVHPRLVRADRPRATRRLAMSSAPPELPDWVKSLGLPKVATDAIDRYWKPVWDEVKHELEPAPRPPRRPAQAPPPADGESARRSRPSRSRRRASGGEPSFRAMWPAYRRWYLKEGESARLASAPAGGSCGEHMPELLPTYERLVELAEGDELAARFLSLYRPPGFVVGCSQGAWTRERRSGSGAQLRLPGLARRGHRRLNRPGPAGG